MHISAKELSHLLNGSLEGNPDVTVSHPSKIEEGTPDSICFFDNPKYEQYVYTTEASVILVNKDFKPSQPIKATLIRVDNVRESVTLLLNNFAPKTHQESAISSQASIHPSAKIGENVSIGPFVVVEQGVEIGDNTFLQSNNFIGKNTKLGHNVIVHSGAKIHHECIIGNHCIIHSNAVIGGDGFGFAPQEDGTFKKVPQIGNVVLEDHVDIGANCTIDRATMGSTIIRKGAKLDNLIMVAHNVEIGENTVIAAQAGVAGSTSIGKNCMIGGQAGFVGHIQVADGVKVQAQSGVARGIKEENMAVYGSPAIPYANYLKSYSVFRNLPELSKEVNLLKKKVQ